MSMKFDEEKPEAYHWRVHTETRIERLEDGNMSHETDLGLLKATYATKEDVAGIKVLITELKVLIAEVQTQNAKAQTATILWVVSAVFLAQLLPPLLKLFVTG